MTSQQAPRFSLYTIDRFAFLISFHARFLAFLATHHISLGYRLSLARAQPLNVLRSMGAVNATLLTCTLRLQSLINHTSFPFYAHI
jgi:hypothetical protein